MMPAMAYKPIFLKQMTPVLLTRTEPASSIVKPAAIHITKKPYTRNANVSNTYCVSESISAYAAVPTSNARMHIPPAIKLFLFIEEPHRPENSDQFFCLKYVGIIIGV